jgi:hypothetical protein
MNGKGMSDIEKRFPDWAVLVKGLYEEERREN